MTEEAFSVGQLVRKAKNALAREFRGPVWVVGEVKSIREQRGNLYLSLVEPGDYADGGDTAINVAAWARRAAVVKAQLSNAGITLAAGMQVRVQGTVTLSKLGNLMIDLIALDVEALMGNQAAEKRKLYESLARENLIDANKRLPTPLVPLRVGLVTSENSEGCNDFLGQLERSGYAFVVTLVHSPVQGPAAPNALARAITRLHSVDIDVIAVVRGGGGELDAFDKEAVARAVATSPIPVWTGIGHTGDHAVADDVAQRAFVTPTECGQALVAAVGEYATRLDSMATRLHTLAVRAVDTAQARIDRRAGELGRCAVRQLDSRRDALRLCVTTLNRSATSLGDRQSEQISNIGDRLLTANERSLSSHATKVEFLRRHVMALDPRRPLQRGYSLTHTQEGQLLTDVTGLSAGDVIVTELARGKVKSVVADEEAS